MRVWQCTALQVQGIGGVEKHIHEVSKGLREFGHEVVIGPRPPEQWLALGRQTATKPVIFHTHGDLWPARWMLERRYKNLDLRWIHVCHGTSLGRVLACRELASLSGWRGSARDFSVAKLSDAAVAVSSQVKREVERFYRLRQPIKVIPNGADPTVFGALKQLAPQPRLIFLGRGDDRVKNTKTLLKACSALRRKHEDLELWAAPGLEDAAPFVKNLGPLSGRQVADALSQCAALVLCSFYEGDPLVLHEGKSMGLPIVASDIAQLRAALAGYPNAFFGDPRNAQDLGSAIERALYTAKPRQPTPQARSWLEVARELAAFYEELS